MKKTFANIITEGIIGIGFGSFSYLVFLLFKWQTTLPTAQNIISIWLMSFLIGALTEIFDFYGMSILTLLVHFCSTVILVLAMTAYNGWLATLSHSPLAWTSVIGLYLFIWLTLFTYQHLSVKRINQKLAQRNQKK
ncbi:DUF3021 family protein [Lactobacillus sp. ESL0677]|uniref:DUF3021 family protein n=1 Tax=Lactobacillus sp. ESL0677 TaxID=2983208 RepID=UPI0023F88C1E|nr:DUF3021 family protein [Lactobacillus sp. ESL0677]WEV36500.1 DUF3021 family protein [Lactobacillus sp. ESL0677]